MAKEHSSGIRFSKGDIINGYKILEDFDPGAFAFTGRAETTRGGKKITVFFKKYKRPGGASPWYQQFVDYQNRLKEIVAKNEAAKSLCYDFIDFFEMKNSRTRAFYQVFEWIEGGYDLRKELDALKGTPSTDVWNKRVVHARVMVAGVNALHQAGIIHTDLKPENFYLVPDSTLLAGYKLRVIDLDYSLLDGKKAPWHGKEGYVGTPLYMSPEHLAETGIPLKASDVFTLAIILGELLGDGHPTSRQPDEKYDELAKSGKMPKIVIMQPIPGVVDLEFLSSVVNSALGSDPLKRPTAQELLQALNGKLDKWNGKSPNTSSRVSPPPIPIPPSPRATSGATTSSPPGHLAISQLELNDVSGNKKLTLKVDSMIGRDFLRGWGNADIEKYMSGNQFRLFRSSGSSAWMIEHCNSAANITTSNGKKLAGAIPVTDGMMVAIGNTGKCPLKIAIQRIP